MQKLPPKPRFCVYCGIVLPTGEQVTRCPGCAAVIPEQFRVDRRQLKYGRPVADVDKSISYCIFCGEFLDKASFFMGICSRCHKDLPRAPHTES